MPWSLICIVFALVLYAIAAFAWPPIVDGYRLRLVAAGLMFSVIAQLVGRAG